MQIPQSCNGKPAIRAGDLVLVRRARWRIVGVRAYEDCRLVTLRGVGAPYRGVERRVLLPFDTIDPIARPTGPRRVRAALWRRACRALIAADAPPGALQTARDARIDLLPHQLEPAIAILRGLGTRILLADAVGLGKTIQAGLVVSELLARGSIDRILVLTPPGLRDQWAQELADRFQIHAAAGDASTLRRLAATLPIGVNPWRTLSIAVASVDYVKRPEVFPAVASCRWDLVIVDEAHACGGDSERRTSVHALAARAAYVMLLSATPHNGDREAFDALCGIGALAGDAPLLVFRRTRADAGIGVPRHIHIVARPAGRRRSRDARRAGAVPRRRAGRRRESRCVAGAGRAAQARVVERLVAGAIGRAAPRSARRWRSRWPRTVDAAARRSPGRADLRGRSAAMAVGPEPVGSGARAPPAVGPASTGSGRDAATKARSRRSSGSCGARVSPPLSSPSIGTRCGMCTTGWRGRRCCCTAA